jgi:hypothetical protein
MENGSMEVKHRTSSYLGCARITQSVWVKTTKFVAELCHLLGLRFTIRRNAWKDIFFNSLASDFLFSAIVPL